MNPPVRGLEIAAMSEVIVPERVTAGVDGAAHEEAFRRTSEPQILHGTR
jgi:hypothetical protein